MISLKICRLLRVLVIQEKKLFSMDSTTTVEDKMSTKSIREGLAEICLKTDKVFYNPVQEFNRDLSIAMLTVFCEEYRDEIYRNAEKKRAKSRGVDIPEVSRDQVDITILEALSATGLRSIRYAKELPNITKIVANDLSAEAVETIEANVVHNQVENLVQANQDDACLLMYKHKHPSKRFAAIDLDPYGCPSIFLDTAVQAVQEGGLLLVTATDMAVLAGNSPETCYCKYGAVSLKTKCCHEMALRILLQCVEAHANRHSRYIEPLLSISADFYVRVFVRLRSGAVHCKRTTSKLSMAYHCVGCDTITLHPLGGFKPNPTEKRPEQTKAFLPTGLPVADNCAHCNQRHHLGGPIWSAPIHDEAFVTKVLSHVQTNPNLFATSKRLEGVLSMVREELNDVPLYYTQDRLFGSAHLETMPMIIMRSAILNAGYRVSYSHAAKNSIKTDAPPALVWDAVRAWAATHPARVAKLESDPVARYILSQPMQHQIDLSPRPDANPTSRKDGQLRFQYNPTPHWGPGSRAAVNVAEEKIAKSILNQNKYRNKRYGGKRQLSGGEEEERKKPHASEEEV